MSLPLIIGGGPAGAAAAIHLAQSGRQATVLERTSGPTDKVCGDFLSFEAVTELRRLGVDLDGLGASTITRLRIMHGRRVAEAALPFTARGLSRRLLDEALLARAGDAGASICRGETVQSVRQAGAGLVWRTGAREAAADVVFLATGKHDLRGTPRVAADGSGAIGMKTYLRLAPEQWSRLGSCIELVLFRGGYAGLQQVEDGRAVLCVTIEKHRFAAAGGTWPALLDRIADDCPLLATRLAGSGQLRDRPVAVAGIPYGYLHRPLTGQCTGQWGGLFRLGDQACVIPSLTGDGIALALYSARCATGAWLAGKSAGAFHADYAASLGGQLRLATWLHRLLLGPGAGYATALAGLAPGLIRAAAARTRLRASAPTHN